MEIHFAGVSFFAEKSKALIKAARRKSGFMMWWMLGRVQTALKNTAKLLQELLWTQSPSARGPASNDFQHDRHFQNSESFRAI
jgi:hypothetical protein